MQPAGPLWDPKNPLLSPPMARGGRGANSKLVSRPPESESLITQLGIRGGEGVPVRGLCDTYRTQTPKSWCRPRRSFFFLDPPDGPSGPTVWQAVGLSHEGPPRGVSLAKQATSHHSYTPLRHHNCQAAAASRQRKTLNMRRSTRFARIYRKTCNHT